jgi:thymidylate synthase
MEYIADGVGKCDIGNLIMFSESAHIYWFNWPEVAKLLGETMDVPFCKKIAVSMACA